MMDNGRKGKRVFITFNQEKKLFGASPWHPKSQLLLGLNARALAQWKLWEKKGFNFQNPKFSSQDGLPKELIPQGVHMDIQWDIPQDTRNGNSQLVASEKINWWFCTEKTDREELTPKGGVGWVCSHHNLGKEMENPWKLFLVFQLATHQWRPQPHKKNGNLAVFLLNPALASWSSPWSTGLLNSSIFQWFKCQLFS